MTYTSVMLFWFELQVSIAVLISRFFFSLSKLLYLFLRSGHDGGEHGWPWHDWSLQGHQAVLEHLVLGDQFLGHVAAVKLEKLISSIHNLRLWTTKLVLFINIWVIIFSSKYDSNYSLVEKILQHFHHFSLLVVLCNVI